MGNDAIKERRKKATLKKIERKHAGKITQPYRLLEELIEKHHPGLKEATFCLLWKSGWRANKDRILKRAQVRKSSEAEREIYGEYDYLIFLHRELWASGSFAEESRRHDVDHELCHCEPEIDDATGEQRKDERGRLCWRVRSHPIQTFPELVERYGLEVCTGIDDEALEAVDDEEAEESIRAEENDADRPLIRHAENVGANGKAKPAQPLDWPPKAVASMRIRLLGQVTVDGVTLGTADETPRAWVDDDGDVFLAQRGRNNGVWYTALLDAEEYEEIEGEGVTRDEAQSAAAASKSDGWRSEPIEALGISAAIITKLAKVGIETLGQLSDWMAKKGEFWAKDIPGIGEAKATEIADRFASFWEKHPEYTDAPVASAQ